MYEECEQVWFSEALGKVAENGGSDTQLGVSREQQEGFYLLPAILSFFSEPYLCSSAFPSADRDLDHLWGPLVFSLIAYCNFSTLSKISPHTKMCTQNQKTCYI